MFDTERLVLRPFIESDLDHLLRIGTNPKSAKVHQTTTLSPFHPLLKRLCVDGYVGLGILTPFYFFSHLDDSFSIARLIKPFYT